MISLLKLLPRVKFIIAVIIFSNTGFHLHSQPEPPPIIDFFQSLYHYQFPKASKQLASIGKNYPNTDYYSLSQANYYWWKFISGEQNHLVEQSLHESLERIIQRYSNRDPESLSADELFAIVHAFAYQSRLAIHHKRRIKALRNLNKIYPYLKIILENPERNDKIRFLAGLYHYIAAVTYEEYPFARPFLRLVPDANKEYGYQLLEKAAQSEHPLIRTEAIYFIMKINLEMSGQYKLAEFWSQQLIREYPDNLIYLMYHLHVLTKSGQAHKAVQTLADIKNKTYTIKGLTQLQRLHVLKESLDYLMKNKK